MIDMIERNNYKNLLFHLGGIPFNNPSKTTLKSTDPDTSFRFGGQEDLTISSVVAAHPKYFS